MYCEQQKLWCNRPNVIVHVLLITYVMKRTMLLCNYMYYVRFMCFVCCIFYVCGNKRIYIVIVIHGDFLFIHAPILDTAGSFDASISCLSKWNRFNNIRFACYFKSCEQFSVNERRCYIYDIQKRHRLEMAHALGQAKRTFCEFQSLLSLAETCFT